MVSQDQIKDATERCAKLERCLGIEQRRIDLLNEQERTEEPDFWNDAEAARRQLKKVADIKSWIDDFEAVRKGVEDLQLLPDFVAAGVMSEEEIDAEYAATVERIEKLELRQMLGSDEDKLGAIMDINAGAGGTEALDWASMLMRMYTRWGEAHGYRVKVMDYQAGDEVGVKSCTLEFEGDFAYGYLKSENGVHRLVRVSPFDGSGRRHTSFASVEVLPEFEDDNSIELNDEDLEITAHRSSGAGGQHINKTDSAIRIVHIPTGIVVGCQTERSQLQNKETALKMLKSKLMEIKEREKLERIEDIQGNKTNIEWGNQIRSYVFMPYTLAKDTRTGYENGNIQSVMDGNLDGFINAYLKMNAAK